MKKILAILAILSTACTDGFNETMCLEAVQKDSGVSDVKGIPGFDFRYLVKKQDGSIWYYEALSKDAVVTAKVKIF